jgi:hypothetical protein
MAINRLKDWVACDWELRWFSINGQPSTNRLSYCGAFSNRGLSWGSCLVAVYKACSAISRSNIVYFRGLLYANVWVFLRQRLRACSCVSGSRPAWLSLSLSHTLTLSLSLSHSLSLSLSISISLYLSLSLSFFIYSFISLSLSHTFTYTVTHTDTNTYPYTASNIKVTFKSFNLKKM